MGTTFKYLGRQTASCVDDWPAYLNLKKARAKWTVFSIVLIQDGANKQTSGMFFKVVA
jgi:secreted protein with Ig-like and vWFA domain